MMPLTTRIAVLNSLLYIRDPSTDELPTIWEETSFWATPSCVAVSCLPDCDGTTEIRLGAGSDVALAYAPLFDRRLKTPGRTIAVETVLDEKVLQMSVPGPETRVRIWTNGYRDTDQVVIGLG